MIMKSLHQITSVHCGWMSFYCWLLVIISPCWLFAAKVHVGKPGGGVWGPLERSVCSLPSARTREKVFIFGSSISSSSSCSKMLMVFPLRLGGHSERCTGCSLCGGLLHLPLASGPRWRAVWTQGVVQHRS